MFVFLSGHGGWLRKFLAGDFWAPLAKLTYGAYLIQAPLMEAVLWGTSTQPVFFTVPQTLARGIQYWTASYFFALVVFLLVEAPFGHLQALLFGLRPLKQEADQARGCYKASRRVKPVAEDGAGEPAGTVVDIGASALPGVDATRTDHGPGPRHRFSPRDAAEDDVPLSPPTSPPYREMVGIVKKHTPNNVMS